MGVFSQRELEEGEALCAAAGFFVRLGAHEVAHERDVGVDLVVGEGVEVLGDGVVIGVHPGLRGVGADELEAQGADAAAAGHLDGGQL